MNAANNDPDADVRLSVHLRSDDSISVRPISTEPGIKVDLLGELCPGDEFWGVRYEQYLAAGNGMHTLAFLTSVAPAQTFAGNKQHNPNTKGTDR